MPQCCAVPMCSKKTGGHKFPKDKIRLKQWLVAIRRDRYMPTNNSLVCKDHFSKDDYELPKDSVLEKPRPMLKKNAVPSRFPWNEADYLCVMKAKLKRKSIKWKQSCDGKDPVMCNTNDFNEIRLRMLQVLRKDVSSSQESQDSHTSELKIEDNNNYNCDHNKGENYEIDTLTVEVPDVKPKLECIEQNSLLTNDTSSPDLQSRLLVFEDEFDYLGKNVAEQLRTLPLSVALETQEMLLSVLKKQRLKVLHNSDPLSQN